MTRARPRTLPILIAAAVVALVALAALLPATAAAQAGPTPVMGSSALTADQITAWYQSMGITSRSPTPVRELAEIFLEEGQAQGVRGDIAFAQSMLETGYLRYGGLVRPGDHNFSGLGACDRCARGLQFADPVLGIRAQIQHLYAYGDPLAAPERLARPLADIRFDLVSPKGRAATWEQMGSGNWASDAGYPGKVLSIWRAMLAYSGVPEPVSAAPATTALAVLATRAGAARVGGWRLRRPLADGIASLGTPARLTAAGGGCLARWPQAGAVALLSGAGDPCATTALPAWLRLSGPAFRTPRGLAPGDTLERLRGLYPAARVRAGRWWLVWGRAADGAPAPRLSAEVRRGVVTALWVVPAPAA